MYMELALSVPDVSDISTLETFKSYMKNNTQRQRIICEEELISEIITHMTKNNKSLDAAISDFHIAEDDSQALAAKIANKLTSI